ncbi:PfaB family protein [Leptolyngbya sp. AN03gr2]|uniref:PfaB family protein n=1 Tax=unclassified Leptolyngbya TaxID=2650499 RepID=UPI003D31621B
MNQKQIPLPKLAIVGMDASFGNCDSLAAFDRCIYQGESALTEERDPVTAQMLLIQVCNGAISDARLKENLNIAVIASVKNETVPDSDRVNLVASQLAAHWNFSGSTFSLTAEEDASFKALEVAQQLLASQSFDAVLIAAVRIPGGGSGALVLKRLDTARRDQDKIYAVVEAVSRMQMPDNTSAPTSDQVYQVCQQALAQAQRQAAQIGYLEVSGAIPQEDAAEIAGLIQAYASDRDQLHCAIGSVKANMGHAETTAGIAGLIKVALCLYYKYLPRMPHWSKPKHPSVWQGSSFYVPTETCPWYYPPEADRRIAAINSLGFGQTCHIILSEEPGQRDRTRHYLQQRPFYLFAIAATDQQHLSEQLEQLQLSIQATDSLAGLARQVHAEFERRSHFPHAAVILGHHKEELDRELQRAIVGIPTAFAQQQDWKTPIGSYFTPNPQGQTGDVAFVYPGGFTAYPGMARDMFRAFPQLLDTLHQKIRKPATHELLDKAMMRVYPRSLEKLSGRQLEKLETELLEDCISTLMAGPMIAQGYTLILRDHFRIQPKAAFGYSLGEYSMLLALGVWDSAEETARQMTTSALFRDRLMGAKNAVRQHWGLPLKQDPADQSFWGIYIVIHPLVEVLERLRTEERVYLTQINTPNEVVLAGDPEACLRVIQSLKCSYFRAPFQNVIHCSPARSELEELTQWFTLPVQPQTGMKFYSAADYQRLEIASQSLGDAIARMICQPLDFPRLVEQVYADGARIFVEVGAATTCTRWISEILKPHSPVTTFTNSRGIDDHTSLLKLLAKLVSHRVPLTLAPLYLDEFDTLHLDRNEPIRELQPSGGAFQKQRTTESELRSHPDLASSKSFSRQDAPSVAIPTSTQSHAAFLQTREAELRQINDLIQLQVKVAEKMLSQPSQVLERPSLPASRCNAVPIYDQAAVLEFAQGRIAAVFGTEYSVIDTYPRRVRLPMPPYLFISRVTQLDAKQGCFEPCSIETEYDIPIDAWYSVDGYLPTSVLMEACQSNMFLISYLGIDFENKGQRVYRALDGSTRFFNKAPKVGETLCCKLDITSFVRGSDTLLFFYTCNYFVRGQRIMELKSAGGFFTDDQLKDGSGATFTKIEQVAKSKIKKQRFEPLLHCDKTHFSEQDLSHLTHGNLTACFGKADYSSDRNPALRMFPLAARMIDRVLSVDPFGGAWGLGAIVGEKRLKPDDWYFNCHFKDDFCLPGTMMMSGAIQLLQFYLLYLGFHSRMVNASLQPTLRGLQSARNRGQILPSSGSIRYEIEMCEVGLEPDPYVIAQVMVIYKGKTISILKDLGFRLATDQ